MLFEKEGISLHLERAFALHGMGTTKLALGDPTTAIPLLSQALQIRQQPGGDPLLLAETQFALAQALSNAGRNHRRALSLTLEARRTFAARSRLPQERAARIWLARHAQHRHRETKASQQAPN